MSSELSPTFATVGSIRTSIQSTLKNDLPADIAAAVISPLLDRVNEWSGQIPTMLAGSGNSASANLIFAIRKDIFIAPQYNFSVFGTALVDLPLPFQEFSSFIHKLIDAQKVDKDKPITKVRLINLHLF
jgi:hypothetical protein